MSALLLTGAGLRVNRPKRARRTRIDTAVLPTISSSQTRQRFSKNGLKQPRQQKALRGLEVSAGSLAWQRRQVARSGVPGKFTSGLRRIDHSPRCQIECHLAIQLDQFCS